MLSSVPSRVNQAGIWRLSQRHHRLRWLVLPLGGPGMLFRTVFGPELAVVYDFLRLAKRRVDRLEVYRAFLPQHTDLRSVSAQGIDDALSFLVSTDLIQSIEGTYLARPIQAMSFRLGVLQQVRRLQLGEIEARHVTDPLYMLILDEVFVQPNRLYVDDLHGQANRLHQVKEVGGLSREKLQAWKRVMSYLGLGWRAGNGFICACTPDLLSDILDAWPYSEGSLQTFLEEHVAKFMPFQTTIGGLADSIGQSLLHLAENQTLTLDARHDSPTKPYFGERRLRHLARAGGVI